MPNFIPLASCVLELPCSQTQARVETLTEIRLSNLVRNLLQIHDFGINTTCQISSVYLIPFMSYHVQTNILPVDEFIPEVDTYPKFWCKGHIISNFNPIARCVFTYRVHTHTHTNSERIIKISKFRSRFLFTCAIVSLYFVNQKVKKGIKILPVR